MMDLHWELCVRTRYGCKGVETNDRVKNVCTVGYGYKSHTHAMIYLSLALFVLLNNFWSD